jgi:hypothetical protein
MAESEFPTAKFETIGCRLCRMRHIEGENLLIEVRDSHRAAPGTNPAADMAPDLVDQFRIAAGYVNRILRGREARRSACPPSFTLLSESQ